MDAVVDDEKKLFDAETAQDDDSQPDPEEHLMLDQGNGHIWLVKVRKGITVVFETSTRRTRSRSTKLPLLNKIPHGAMVSYQC